MIHYHGLPITPASAAADVISQRHAFVSFAHPDQLAIAVDVSQSFALDNGAFSAWKSGHPITDWSKYYEWVREVSRIPHFDFAVIPDVIDGTEKENDALMYSCPIPKHFSAPVWHMHESLERLKRLTDGVWNRVCFGSSGDYSTPGTEEWWGRMAEAMDYICDEGGRPPCKLHGLRMLDPAIFSRLPFASADSTNVGRNVGIDGHWRGTYAPPDKSWRARVIAARVESYNGAVIWEGTKQQKFQLGE